MGMNRGSFDSINDNADYTKKIQITSGVAEANIPIDMNGNEINGVSTDLVSPANTDAANVQYVLSKISGLDPSLQHTNADYANAAGQNIDPTTADGTTLIDGHAAAGHRILLHDQTDPLANGVWDVSAGGVWTRATDMNTGDSLVAGEWIIVTNGATMANSGWYTSAAVASIGTDPITFSCFTSGSSVPVSNALLLDCSNDPLTGDLHMTKVLPKLTMTDSTAGSYATIEKQNASNKLLVQNMTDVSTASGYSINLDGTTGTVVDAGEIASLKSIPAYSLSYWVYHNADPVIGGGGYGTFYHGDSYGGLFGAASSVGLGTSIPFHIQRTPGAATSNQVRAAGVHITKNNWHHIVWTFDGTAAVDSAVLGTGVWQYIKNCYRLRCYFDGVLVPHQTLTSAGSYLWFGDGQTNTSYTASWDGNGSTIKTGFGATPNGTTYRSNAKFDEVLFFNKALSAGEVATLWGGGYTTKGTATGSTTGLIAGWHCDEGSGTNLADIKTSSPGTAAGGYSWVSETGPSTPTLVDVITSISPAVAGDGDGINTFGDSDAGTILAGKYVQCANTPSDVHDVANKEYVDAAGLYHIAVRAIQSTATGTYSSTGNGTITGAGFVVMPNPDGVSAVVGDRLLFNNRGTQAENGVYEFTQQGDTSSKNWICTRVDDWKHGSTFYKGSTVVVTEGTYWHDSMWASGIVANSGTIGTDDPLFAEVGTSPYTLGQGLAGKLSTSGGTISGWLDIYNNNYANDDAWALDLRGLYPKMNINRVGSGFNDYTLIDKVANTRQFSIADDVLQDTNFGNVIKSSTIQYFSNTGTYPTVGTNNWSFAAWVRHDGVSDALRFGFRDNGETHDNIALYMSGTFAGYVPMQAVVKTGTGYKSFSYVCPWVSNRKHTYMHYAFVFDYAAETLVMYINGQVVPQTTGFTGTSDICSVAGYMAINVGVYGTYSSDIRYYQGTKLSAGDVAAIYNNGCGDKTALLTGLTNHWLCSEATGGTTLADATSAVTLTVTSGTITMEDRDATTNSNYVIRSQNADTAGTTGKITLGETGVDLNLEGNNLSINGTDGFTGTVASPSSITVVNGIITAMS